MYRRDTTPFSTGFYQILYETPLAHSLFPKMKVDLRKQNVRTFENFYEFTGLTEANFLRPLAKLCVQDTGCTPKKITDPVCFINKGFEIMDMNPLNIQF